MATSYCDSTRSRPKRNKQSVALIVTLAILSVVFSRFTFAQQIILSRVQTAYAVELVRAFHQIILIDELRTAERIVFTESRNPNGSSLVTVQVGNRTILEHRYSLAQLEKFQSPPSLAAALVSHMMSRKLIVSTRN